MFKKTKTVGVGRQYKNEHGGVGMRIGLDAVTLTNGKEKTVQPVSSLSSIKEGDRQTETCGANVGIRQLKPQMGELIVKVNLSCSK